jgi:glycine betaine/choline ABC-type transport system substrate-binding protein
MPTAEPKNGFDGQNIRRMARRFGHDFMVRPDGYQGFSRAYSLRFAGQ